MKNRAPTQARTRPRKAAPDRRPFTHASIYDLVVQAAKRNPVKATDPALAAAAAELNSLQAWVKLNEIHWSETKNNRQRLAEALMATNEVLPQLRAEILQARTWHLEDCDKAAADHAGAAIEIIDNLYKAVAATGDCALILHPELLHVFKFRWERFSANLFGICQKHFQCLSAETYYRMMVGLIPDMTGETVTADAVRTHIMKGRGAARGRPADHDC